jgi:O-antigen ligase
VAFWRQAWADGLEQPWVGVGQLGYEQRQRAAVAQGAMPALAVRYNHAHNEWLDMFAKRGLLGVWACCCSTPCRACCSRTRCARRAAPPYAQRARRAAALCGLTTVLAYPASA